MMPELTAIAFYAVIAVVVLLRLHGTLGKNNEGTSVKNNNNKSDNGNIIELNKDEYIKEFKQEEAEQFIAPEAKNEVLEQWKAAGKADNSFSLKFFIEGAEKAYEMLFNAFNKNELSAIRIMTDDSMYKKFKEKVEQKAESEEKADNTLVAISKFYVKNIAVSNDAIKITTYFLSEQLHLTKNKAGEIIRGHPSKIIQIEDNLVFEKKIGSNNPRWLLVDIFPSQNPA